MYPIQKKQLFLYNIIKPKYFIFKLYKSLSYNLCLNQSLYFILNSKNNKQIGSMKQFLTKKKNYWMLTGRTRSVYQKLKISRICLRILGLSG
jgi:ribosomal protein S14